MGVVGYAAIRKGDWKIAFVQKPLGPEEWRLYYLSTDPGETVDISEQYPEKFAELLDRRLATI